MNIANKIMRLAILATVFAFVLPVAFAGTVTVQHGTLSATLGAPVNFSYTPDWYVVNDPTHTIGLGLQPYATLGSTMASVQCQGSANLSMSQNPGWNTLSLNPSSGTATMNLGLTAGLNIEFIAFGHTLQGSLNNTPNWGFTDSKNFSSYLLTSPVTLSGQISHTLVSLNTLDALTLEFGVVIPSWLAGINLNINAVANLDQTIQGANISTSAGAFTADGQSLNVYTSGTSYQLQNVQETWSDSATLSLGLGADMTADLLWDVLSVQLVDFGNVTLISASQTYQLQSSAISTVSFDLSTGGGSTVPVISTVSPSTMTGLPTGQIQLIRIIGSGFTSTSTLTFNDGVNPSYTGRVPSSWSANELDYNISVGTNQANWSVVVVNGVQTSNMKYFTVNAPSAAPTGSLVVNLSPTGANTAGAQWLLNGSYHNSGDAVTALTPGQYTVSFKSISGYTTPASQIVNITASTQTTASATYSTIAPATYTLTLNYNNLQGGASALPLASGNIYNSGAIVQVYASASSGYHFTGWSGDASGTNNPVTVTMNGNKTVAASFASGDPSLATVTVTINPAAAANAGVTWSVTGDSQLRASGTSLSEAVGSGYTTLLPVTLNLVSGWLSSNGVTSFYVPVTAGIVTNVVLTCMTDTTPGLLTVTLSPPDVVTAGAKWHVNGTTNGNGATISLPAGAYPVTFDAVSGWTAPASQSVTIQRSQTAVLAGNYTPPAGQPAIYSISPPIGAMTGGTLMTISGANFTSPATVIIGGQNASNVTILNASQITCITPSSSSYGSTNVIVQTSGGSATNQNAFAYGMAYGSKLDLASAVGGNCYGLYVSGNYAYMGEGRKLIVINTSTLSKVGEVTLPGNIVYGVQILNQYAYVANGNGGLQVVDVSNPATPKIKGVYSPTNSWSWGITIYGGRVYLVDDSAGLEIFDLGNPSSPTLLSSTNIGSGKAVLVKATSSGVFAYVSAGGNLRVVDVSSPYSPVARGQTSIGNGGVFALTSSGNYVIGADGYGSMHMVDVSNPDVPVDSTPATGDNGTGGYVSVAAVNNYLYAESSVQGIGFCVFSISGSSLTRVGQNINLYANPSAFFGRMIVSGNQAYVACAASGLQIVNISNPGSPSLSASFNDAGVYGNYSSVGVTGDILCASDGNNFKTFDASQTGQPPSPIGQVSGISASTLTAANGLAYVKASDGVRLYGLATPSAPVLKSTIPNSVIYPYCMQVIGNMLYMAGYNGSGPRFVAVDVSNPLSPVTRGTMDISSTGFALAQTIAVNGSKALVGISGGRISILDISTISSPVERASLATVNVCGIRISPDGNYAYYVLYESPSVLHVINISNLSSPSVVTNIPLDASQPSSIGMRNNELYIGTRELYVFDISNPSSPQLTRSYLLSGINTICAPTESVNQSANIYAAANDGGIVVMREQDIQAPNIYITDPVFGSTWTTTTSTTELGGGSDDNVGVTAITWVNDRGGSGSISAPFDSWYVTGIKLYPGTNSITATAYDAAGNSGHDTLAIYYQTTNQNQAITFPAIADHTFGDAPISLLAAASSGLPVTFSVTSGPATLSISNVLMLTGAGAVTVEADQPGGNGINPATPVDMNFNVARANQSILLPPISAHLASDAPFTLTATASSGLPVTFSIFSGPATVNSSNVITLLGSGTVKVIAGQPGNSNYNAAASVQGSFTVAGSPQFITFGSLSQQRSVDAPFQIYASASSGLPVSFSVLSGPAQLSGNVLTLTGAGTVTVRASQIGNSIFAPAANVDQSLTVLPPNNTIGSPQYNVSGFNLTFYGTVGSNYLFQASSNLVNWTSLQSFTCTNSIMSFRDTSATGMVRRFYQIKPQ